MYITITKCSSPSYWYADKIGESFEVEVYSERDYILEIDMYDDIKRLITISDCEPTLIPKPPLGIIPNRLWKEERLHNLRDAIQRYLGRATIPIEWVEEYNQLTEETSK